MERQKATQFGNNGNAVSGTTVNKGKTDEIVGKETDIIANYFNSNQSRAVIVEFHNALRNKYGSLAIFWNKTNIDKVDTRILDAKGNDVVACWGAFLSILEQKKPNGDKVVSVTMQDIQDWLTGLTGGKYKVIIRTEEPPETIGGFDEGDFLSPPSKKG